MKKMKVASLVFDFDFYPRNNINPHNVNCIAEAIVAGVEMPPGIIDKKSRRIVDGFHRGRAYAKVYGDDAEMLVVEKNYANDAEMFLDAMRYNASHGCALDSSDRAHCIILSERLNIPLDAVAGALHMTTDKLSALRNGRIAKTSGGLSVPLKRTIQSFAGRRLTKRQVEANDKLSGMNQSFYANQLIELIESDLLDVSDENLMDRLRVLNGLLDGVLAAK
jgi:hypothetical protein